MAQNSPGNSMALKTSWERLHLLDKCGTKDPFQKADVLRLLLLQSQWARAEQMCDGHAASDLFLKYAEHYSKVVDSPNPKEGANNYAESALTLLEGKPNESKKWTSSLKDKIKSMKCVNDCLQLSKTTEGMLYLEDKLDVPMKLTKPEVRSLVREAPVSSIAGLNTPVSEVNVSVDSRSVKVTKPFNDAVPNFNLNMNDSVPKFNPVNGNLDNSANQNGQLNGNHNAYLPNNSGSPKFGNGANLKGQPSVNRKPGLLGDPSQRDGSANSWNPNPARNNCQSDEGPFRKFKGKSGNFGGASNEPGFGGPSRGFNGSNQPPGNDYRDGGPSHQKRGLFSSVKSNSESTGRPPQDFGNVENEDDSAAPGCGFFKSAREQLAIDNQKKFGRDKGGSLSSSSYGNAKKSLGTRRGPTAKFVPPVMNREDEDDGGTLVRRAGPSSKGPTPAGEEEIVDERLKNIEPKMIELITNEIMDHGPPIIWDDIAGLDFAKNTIKEIVVWPMLRPDIFTGLRGPPKGLLLFGPPGTGKTLIGKCIASQSKSTFFSISASSLTSKWVGEGEKMVRALFAVARVHQPAVIFLDEIDSLLSQRSDGEQEASRRIKTEFLVQLDGATTSSDERILCVGATNRPQEIDEAARRRFVKRLYIPLPESPARRQIVVNLLQGQSHCLTESDLENICQNTDGYSGADMANLCREAALGPIRSINFCDIENITADQVRPITASDFQNALKNVRPSVSSKDLVVYLDWNKQFGTWDI